jgi:D-alanyl-D-alanine carboxypeptidase
MPLFVMFRSGVLATSILLLLLVCVPGCNGDGDAHNEELIVQMKEATDKIIETTHVPGIVALVADHARRINWVYAAGVSDIPNNIPANPSYTFRIGSNTKTLVVTVLLQLVAEGKISLDDKLSKFFPEFPNANRVTVAMLCNMTSGIPNYTEDEYFTDRMLNQPKRVWAPIELARIGLNKKFNFEPGTSWKYSNTNTILLGMIIEQVTQNTLRQEIENRIAAKLGLRQTGFLTSGTEFPGVHGRGYYEDEYVEGADMTGHYDISWGWAAGSAYSTPRELQRYVEALVGGGLLPDDMQTIRFSEHIIHLSETISYGLGFLRRGTFYGHNGSLPGFTSSMYHSPAKNCTVIIYFNSQLEEAIPDQLFARFMEILYGGDF